MIKKLFELDKLKIKNYKYFLFYGANEGAKNEVLSKIIDDSKINKIIKFEEKKILENNSIFYDEISSRSFFENEKIIIINRATDKLLKVIESIFEKENDDLIVIIDSGVLEKKSKLRNLFETGKDLICVPFYADSLEILSKFTLNFLKEKKINISQSNINILVNRCNGDRGILKNELNKIEFFALNKKNITTENILKLTNLTENYTVLELVNYCLAKDKRKTTNILNENNFSNEDCIIITRTFLNKSKNILKLAKEFEKNKNIDLTISSAKPPIFWKDKEITKKQIFSWKPKKIQNLIYKISQVELEIKKNLNNPINTISDFILEQSSLTNN